MADHAVFLRRIALHLIEHIDDIKVCFFVFDDQEHELPFKFQGVDCQLNKYRRSSPRVRPPYIHWAVSTTKDGVRFGNSADFWLLNPHVGDPEVNRAAFKRALERFRNQPSVVLVEIDLQAPVSFIAIRSYPKLMNLGVTNSSTIHDRSLLSFSLHLKRYQRHVRNTYGWWSCRSTMMTIFSALAFLSFWWRNSFPFVPRSAVLLNLLSAPSTCNVWA